LELDVRDEAVAERRTVHRLPGLDVEVRRPLVCTAVDFAQELDLVLVPDLRLQLSPLRVCASASEQIGVEGVFESLGGGWVGGSAGEVDVLGGGDLGLAELVGDLACGLAGLVQGSGGGFAEGVGADPGELVRFGGLDGFLELGEPVGSVVEVDAVDRDEAGDQLVVGFDAAGFDEFESGLGPSQGLCGLFAAEAFLAAEGAEGLAELAGGAGDGRQGGPEGSAGVGRVAVAADRVGETGVSGRVPPVWRARRMVAAQVGRLRTRSPVLDLVVLRISPSPGSRAMVWLISTVPASWSIWFQRTASASPIRTPVPSMNVTRSGRSACTACLSAVRLLFRRVTSSAVSARGGLLGLASMVSTSRAGLVVMAP
jgi:hypothetical protein